MSTDDSLAPAARRSISHALTDQHIALLLGGVALAAALAARLLWPFDGLYGQDAFAYFRYARALWPWLLHGTALPIYYWPAGYPLLVALVLPLSGGSSAAGQLVSSAAAASTAALTFLLCRELLPDAPASRVAALVAGLIVALSGALLRVGLVVMADATALACCAAALYALVRYTRTRRGRWLVGAALALGWAIITRWVCGLLALPMLLYLLADQRSMRGTPQPRSQQQPASAPVSSSESTKDTKDTKAGSLAHEWAGYVYEGHLHGLNEPAQAGFVDVAEGFSPTVPLDRVRPVMHWLAAAALGALIVVPQIIVSGATGAPPSQQQWVVAWNIANAWQRDFTTVDGTQHYALPVAAFYLAQMAWPSFLAPPLALLCLAGALWLVRRRRWPALTLLVGWPLALWLFLSGIPYQNNRFVLPALPALAGLAGLGFGWLYAAVGRRRLLLAGLAVALAIGLALGVRDYRKLVAYENDQLALVDWVRARLPADSTLITFGATLTLQHYTDADVRELYYLEPPDLDAIVRRGQPTYLLLDVGSTEQQWVGLRPQRDYHYLQTRPGLEVVGQRAPYTLFRVKAAGG
jgi:4-amino-4-deoxy-L-arabinose transferase-like glycosyltransferase